MIFALVMARGVWEFAFGVLMLFTTFGVIYSMLTEKHGSRWGLDDFVEVTFIVLLPIFLLFLMQAIAVGDVHDIVEVIIAEYVNWWYYLALLITVFFINKVMVKR